MMVLSLLSAPSIAPVTSLWRFGLTSSSSGCLLDPGSRQFMFLAYLAGSQVVWLTWSDRTILILPQG